MMIQNLSVDERKMFLKELKKVVGGKDAAILPPSTADLRQLAYHNSLPFVGFGFLDNFIMIMAGEYIDMTLGKKTPFLLFLLLKCTVLWKLSSEQCFASVSSCWEGNYSLMDDNVSSFLQV